MAAHSGQQRAAAAVARASEWLSGPLCWTRSGGTVRVFSGTDDRGRPREPRPWLPYKLQGSREMQATASQRDAKAAHNDDGDSAAERTDNRDEAAVEELDRLTPAECGAPSRCLLRFSAMRSSRLPRRLCQSEQRQKFSVEQVPECSTAGVWNWSPFHVSHFGRISSFSCR